VVKVKFPSSSADSDLFKLSIELQIMINRLVEVGRIYLCNLQNRSQSSRGIQDD
jgi:hypothetical protein